MTLSRVTPPPIVLVAGNPNSGKSTLFNALTGARAHVANYPGVTIDRISAPLAASDGSTIEVVDLPGTYSLSARSREEQIAVDALLGRHLPAPHAVVGWSTPPRWAGHCSWPSRSSPPACRS